MKIFKDFSTEADDYIKVVCPGLKPELQGLVKDSFYAGAAVLNAIFEQAAKEGGRESLDSTMNKTVDHIHKYLKIGNYLEPETTSLAE